MKEFEYLQDMQSVQFDTAAVKQALEHNAEFFIQFFLGEELTMPVPDFHVDVFLDMTNLNLDRVADAIPRDHAKTTLARLATVWYFLFSPFRFTLYTSASHSLAVPSTNAIIGFMECENFKHVFGELDWIKRQDGIGHYEFRLGNKYCILKAHGAGQSVRGLNVDNQRPQLGIIDDLEDDKTIATPELFMQLKRWLYGAFFKCFDKRGNKKIWLGNLIKRQSNLWEICESEFWHVRRYGCLKADGTSLWPDFWPFEKLKQDYLEYEKAGMADIWFAEMMNCPVNLEGSAIRADQISYRGCPLPEHCDYTFATVDLAISDKKWANKTVVTVHAMYDDFPQCAAQYAWKGIDPITLFWEIIRICREWRIGCVGIESVAFQASLQYVYPHLCRENYIDGITFVPLEASGRKNERILTWLGLVKTGQYYFTHGDMALTESVLNWDPTVKDQADDEPDSASYYSQMIEKWMPEILESRNYEPIDNAGFVDSYRNCPV